MDAGSSSTGYSVEVDRASTTEWTEVCLQFCDATINQTWAFGATLSGRNSMSHLVLKRDNVVVAAAQVRIVTLPVLGGGIAYVSGGPMWRRRAARQRDEDLLQIVRALRQEYVVRRGLLLRVVPSLFVVNGEESIAVSSFVNQGFKRCPSSHQTLFLDLRRSLDDLRQGLHQKWRNCLNSAERNNMKTLEGTGEALYEKFKAIYYEMRARKKFPSGIDIEKYGNIQNDLPDALRPRIILCELEQEVIAGAILATAGDTGVYLLGATSDKGLVQKASYLVQWRAIQWLKSNGYLLYDLGGVDPEKVPSTYRFKARICGKVPVLYKRIGEFVCCESPKSFLVVKVGLLAGRCMRWLKSKAATGS